MKWGFLFNFNVFVISCIKIKNTILSLIQNILNNKKTNKQFVHSKEF